MVGWTAEARDGGRGGAGTGAGGRGARGAGRGAPRPVPKRGMGDGRAEGGGLVGGDGRKGPSAAALPYLGPRGRMP